MQSSLWATIDPDSEWRVTPPAYSTTDDTAAAATQSSSNGVPFWSPQHPHFGFGVIVLGTAALLYLGFEGKVSGRVGPLQGEVEAGAGKEK